METEVANNALNRPINTLGSEEVDGRIEEANLERQGQSPQQQVTLESFGRQSPGRQSPDMGNIGQQTSAFGGAATK